MKCKIIEKEKYIKEPNVFSLMQWDILESKTIKDLLTQLDNVCLIKKWHSTNKSALYEIKQDNQRKYLWIEK